MVYYNTQKNRLIQSFVGWI